MSPHSCRDTTLGCLLPGYELGLLDEPDRLRFETHARECAACSEDLYEAAPYVVALRAEPHASLRALTAEVARSAAPRRSPVVARVNDMGARLLRRLVAGGGWRILVPAAAAAIVLAVALWPRSTDVRSLARLEAIPYLPVETRGGGGAGARFRDAMAEYAGGRYAEAARRLEAGLQDDEAAESPFERDRARLFLGVCLLLSNRPDAAVGPLETAAVSEVDAISDRARWYLAQAHLLRGDAERASPLLESLAERSPAYAREASRQLARLRVLEPGSR